MNRLTRALIAASIALGLALPAPAQQAAAEAPVLTLEDALSLASGEQPRLLAFEREAKASEEAAVAARTLPDPEVTAGINNFPIRGDAAFSPVDDFMTMYTIGVMREQVRSSKREAQAERVLAEAQLSRTQANAEERSIRREVMIAWIDAVEARAKQHLLERLISDLRAGKKVIEAGIPTGGSTPALALQADAEIGVQEAQLADARRAEARARASLARWIGPAAQQPLPNALPKIAVSTSAVPPLDAHPEVRVAFAEEQVARRQVDVARQDRRPDISWSVSLGIRPRYGEMVSAGISIPLQLNRRQRQDRLVGEAQARVDAAHLRAEDKRRELERDYRAAVADFQGAEGEIARLERDAAPALEAAFDAAKARYAGGAGATLDQPFVIVRRYVEVTIQTVEARARRARAAAEILRIHGELDQ